ncbi:MAG: hypothetical protein DI551_03420 [Micavibrio aeruginosavorus]|uniref:RNB domain-containing protein n=1 Tax=Micavibrio aeruginosavorus TaxID=349221 RepID=A0A2W5N9K0_9BACT|nr:MAG: hypothetical protein DI551_03420 [Micavibrio aeruginosavorus]
MAKTIPVEYDDKRLRQVVQMNAEGVTIPTLLRGFGLADNDHSFLQTRLQALVDEGFATYDARKKKYAATNPMSNLVVARVSKFLNGNTKVVLEIENMDEEFPFLVTMTSNKLKRIRGPKTVRLNERLAVVLNRHSGVELKARFFGKFVGTKNPTIVGHFNRKAEQRFVPYDPGVSSAFKVGEEFSKRVDPRKSFFASIPSTLDPYNPILEIGDQKWDPETGTPIAIILAKKHGIRIRHDKETYAQSRKVMRYRFDNQGRRDLTNERVLVVDPPDAADHDDGFKIEKTDYGFRTLVTIADVAHYVRPGTHMDREARESGFTHYFPDQTFHNFPARFVRHASLIEGYKKPVIYIEQFWNEYGEEIEDAVIGAGIIASQKQMTYQQLEDLINSDDPSVADYKEMGEILIQNMRFERGITFDTEGVDKNAPFAQSLVSTMMMAGNKAIAEFLLYERVPFPSRSHSGSDNLYAFAETKEVLESWGYDVPATITQMNNAHALNDILMEAERRRERVKVEEFIKRNFLQPASYTMEPFSHFGIGAENYTHATSPIRRYVDLLALRGVHTALGNHELGLSDQDIEMMPRTVNNMNYLQNVARRVHLDKLRYFAISDLLRHEGHVMNATIGRFDGHKAEIILGDKGRGLRKTLDVSNLPAPWGISKDGKRLLFKGKMITENCPIKVKLGLVSPNKAEWDVSDVIPASEVKPKRSAVSKYQPSL